MVDNNCSTKRTLGRVAPDTIPLGLMRPPSLQQTNNSLHGFGKNSISEAYDFGDRGESGAFQGGNFVATHKNHPVQPVDCRLHLSYYYQISPTRVKENQRIFDFQFAIFD